MSEVMDKDEEFDEDDAELYELNPFDAFDDLMGGVQNNIQNEAVIKDLFKKLED